MAVGISAFEICRSSRAQAWQPEYQNHQPSVFVLMKDEFDVKTFAGAWRVDVDPGAGVQDVKLSASVTW
jgi:hypothetical protein